MVGWGRHLLRPIFIILAVKYDSFEQIDLHTKIRRYLFNTQTFAVEIDQNP